jgi:PAS domain S-box-containing protein
MERLGIDFEQLLEAAPDGIVIVDEAGRIVHANGEAGRLFGYSREELIGAPVDMLVPSSRRARHAAYREGYAVHPRTRPMGLGLNLVARRKDRREVPVEISLSPVTTKAGRWVIAAIRDVSEQRRLEKDRETLAGELERERERYRIGMDLHDGVMQSVYAASLTLEMAAEDLDEDVSLARAHVQRAIDQLHEVVREIRSYIFDLRPRGFAGDLPSALANLADEFAQNTRIETAVDIDPRLPEVPEEVGLALYHVAHEALSNVRKHAQASSASIRLGAEDGRLALEIADRGAGFEARHRRSEAHRGLRNMAARMRAAGGRLEVESAPGKGTVVRALGPRLRAGRRVG